MRAVACGISAGSAMPRCNIELKARIASLDACRQIAGSLADVRLPDQHQIDTYFHCRDGRLKLREISGERAETIEAPRQFQEALAMTLGIRSRVEKHREIYLHQNVRIHLDRVIGLGEFLEFEAVLGSEHREAESQRLIDRLRRKFQIHDDDLLEASYGEMVEFGGTRPSR